MTMPTLRGEALANAYAALKSIELGGRVMAFHEGNRLVVFGNELPCHPQHPQAAGSGWALLDSKSPAHAQEYVRNRGCMGQSVDYDPYAN